LAVTATGHHGTTFGAAQLILKEGFKKSSKPEDWLGDGVYFFQDAPIRALAWAEELFDPPFAVIEADIDLTDFIDLLDIGWINWLAELHDQFVDEFRRSGQQLPVQKGGAHRADRALLNFAVEVLEGEGLSVAGIRGAFAEGTAIFPNSALMTRSHVQIAVRRLSAIRDPRIIEAPPLRAIT
jgi:hypothetical protein